jgi:hypothetical protein
VPENLNAMNFLSDNGGDDYKTTTITYVCPFSLSACFR